MAKSFILPTIFVIVLFTLPIASRSQTPPVRPGPPNFSPAVDGWTRKPVPYLTRAQSEAAAPKRDIFGIWNPSNGIQALGAGSMPEDGKPEHQLPYTSLGLEKLKLTNPSHGVRIVLPTETNYPVVACYPQGMPR